MFDLSAKKTGNRFRKRMEVKLKRIDDTPVPDPAIYIDDTSVPGSQNGVKLTLRDVVLLHKEELTWRDVADSIDQELFIYFVIDRSILDVRVRVCTCVYIICITMNISIFWNPII